MNTLGNTDLVNTEQLLIYGPFISHKQAKEQGLKHCYTGKPCKRNHIDIRFVSSDYCFTCNHLRNQKPEQKAANRRYHHRQIETNREVYRARKNKTMRKVHRNRSPERLAEIRQNTRRWLDDGGREWRRNYEKSLKENDPQRAIATPLRTLIAVCV